jgi:hypothetical protein
VGTGLAAGVRASLVSDGTGVATRAGTGVATRVVAGRVGTGTWETHGRGGLLPDGTGTGEAGQEAATVGRLDGTGTGAALRPPAVVGTTAVGTAVGAAAAGAGVPGDVGPVLVSSVPVGSADGAAEAVPSAAGALAVRDAPDDA